MIEAPLIVLGAPRSGTTIVHRCLALHPELWALAGESHAILEGPFHPARGGYASNRVAAEDLDPAVGEQLRQAFHDRAINLNRLLRRPGWLLAGEGVYDRAFNRLAIGALGAVTRRLKPASIRFIEKTPKNTLRVSMLETLFPDARYVRIRRAAEPNVLSIARGWFAEDRIGPWRRQRFTTYPVAGMLGLRDYAGPWWRFALVPDWRSLRGATVADVAAWQYHQCNRFASTDLDRIEPRRVFTIDHAEFARDPLDVVRAILAWADLPPSRTVEDFTTALPRVNQVRPLSGKGNVAMRAAVAAALDRIGALTDAPAASVAARCRLMNSPALSQPGAAS